MPYNQSSFEEFVNLASRRSIHEGINFGLVDGFGTYKISKPQPRERGVDIPAIWMVAHGKKICHVGEQTYEYVAGNIVVMLYPMPVETEIMMASPQEPFVAAGIAIDLGQMTEVLSRIERADGVIKSTPTNLSSIFSISLDDALLDPFIRLIKMQGNSRDAAVLGKAVIEEIYYRLLCDERGGELRFLLQQRGEIQRISKAVEYIHRNLEKPISVDQLAMMAHMGQTTFYENFRSVMHVSPLQYAKSLKLHKAQQLIKEGKRANEAGYLVGYNSPAQFSREYKRHFGVTPATKN